MKSEKYKLLVYIPSYNRYEKLFQKLTLLSASITEEVCLVVSDNCSTDQNYLSLKSHFVHPHIIFERNVKNLGIVGNIVKGFHYNISKYLWILSDDEVISDNAVDEILLSLSSDPDHLYMISKVKGEEAIRGKVSVSGVNNILESFSGASMTGLISANIYNLNIMNPYISAGYNYGHTLFPHSAIFYSCLADQKDFNVLILNNIVEWHCGEISYNNIHSNCWRYFLDLSEIFDGRQRRIFIRKFLKDWGVGHYLNILQKDNNLLRYWFYAMKEPRLLITFVITFHKHLFHEYILNPLRLLKGKNK